MIILGIDPGLATVGFGIIKQEGHKFKHILHGTITTKAGEPLHERLLAISDQLRSLINTYKPDCMAIEELFFGVNTKTALVVGQARGVLLLEAARADLNIYSYKPNEIKMAVCGYGGAKKPQIMTMVKNLLNLQQIPKPDDAADGLAIAICHCHSVKIKSLA